MVAGVGNETYTWTRDSEVATVGHPDGTTTTVMRDAAGRPTRVDAPWATSTFGYSPMTGQAVSSTRAGQRLDWQHDGSLVAMTITVPPLRERPADVEPLARQFLDDAARGAGSPVRDFDADALARLRAYTWPGNVRELRNVIERAVLVADGPVIRPADLGDRVQASGALASGEDLDFRDRMKAIETELILDALKKVQGNQTEAAKILRMPLRTLVHKLKAYGIRP